MRVFYGRILLVCLLLGAFMLVVSNSGNVASKYVDGSGEVPEELVESLFVYLIDSGFYMSIFSMVFGALTVTRGFENRSIGRCVLLSRGSVRLFGYRVLALFPAAVLFAMVGLAVAIGYAFFLLQEYWSRFGLSWDVWARLIGVAMVIVLSAYFGQLWGWLVRKSLIAAVGLVLWTTILEEPLMKLFSEAGWLFPSGSLLAIRMDPTAVLEKTLSPTGGYVLYGLWLLLLGAIAILTLKRQDLPS